MRVIHQVQHPDCDDEFDFQMLFVRQSFSFVVTFLQILVVIYLLKYLLDSQGPVREVTIGELLY